MAYSRLPIGSERSTELSIFSISVSVNVLGFSVGGCFYVRDEIRKRSVNKSISYPKLVACEFQRSDSET